MGTRLRDFIPENTDSSTDSAELPITPQPTAWTMQNRPQKRWIRFTAQTDDISGLILCESGLGNAVRKYPGCDPKELVMSSQNLPEFERDHLDRFKRAYDPKSSYIPYAFGPAGLPKWIHVIINSAIEKNTVFVSE